MIIITGLGNPGLNYINSRHNIGFRVVDRFQEKNNFPEFRLPKKINALILEENLNNKKIILVKPQTFMNESGKAIKKIISNLKFQISNLIVVHDDIDLPLGKIKIVKGRGSAGHKGVESIIKELKTKNFIRFRIGIKPKETRNKRKEIKELVLKKFDKNEEKIMKTAVETTANALDFLLKNGLEKTMNEYNQ